MTISEIIQSIDGRLEKIEREILSLKKARIELVNGGRSGAVQRSRRKPRQQRQPPRPERHRRTQVVSVGVLERLLGESDGLTTAALASRPTPTTTTC